MLSHEVIDGPVDPKYKRFNETLTAANFVFGVESMGWFIHQVDRDEDKRQNFRLASWVEDTDHKLGYAFGLSRTSVIPDSLDDFTINAVYFTVDRDENPPRIVEPPKLFELSSRQEIELQTENALKAFDKTEMTYATSMLGKMATDFQTVYNVNSIDGYVQRGLVEGYMDGLAEMFPEPAKHPDAA